MSHEPTPNPVHPSLLLECHIQLTCWSADPDAANATIYLPTLWVLQKMVQHADHTVVSFRHSADNNLGLVSDYGNDDFEVVETPEQILQACHRALEQTEEASRRFEQHLSERVRSGRGVLGGVRGPGIMRPAGAFVGADPDLYNFGR